MEFELGKRTALFREDSLYLVVCETVSEETCGLSRVIDYGELHLTYLFVDALDELQHEVNELFLFKALQMVIAHQKREVKIFVRWLLSKDFELVGSERHESFQHVSE